MLLQLPGEIDVSRYNTRIKNSFPKFTDYNARKRNIHPKDEIHITLPLEKMEPTLPMLIMRKAPTKI